MNDCVNIMYIALYSTCISAYEIYWYPTSYTQHNSDPPCNSSVMTSSLELVSISVIPIHRCIYSII